MIVLWPDLSHFPPQRNLLQKKKKKKINKRLGFLELHAANDAHRKYCREKVPEREVNWIASVCLCISHTKRVSFYAGPKQASAQSPWLSPGMTSVTRDPSAGSSRTISLSSSFISSQRPQLNEYFSFVSVFSRVTFIKPKHRVSSEAQRQKSNKILTGFFCRGGKIR